LHNLATEQDLQFLRSPIMRDRAFVSEPTGRRSSRLFAQAAAKPYMGYAFGTFTLTPSMTLAGSSSAMRASSRVATPRASASSGNATGRKSH
jgi:hypothetical protein